MYIVFLYLLRDLIIVVLNNRVLVFTLIIKDLQLCCSSISEDLYDLLCGLYVLAMEFVFNSFNFKNR